MPTIFVEAGFRYMIYVHDHAPPHVHVQPFGRRAVRGKVSDAQVRRAVRIANARHGELLSAWSKHHG